MRKPTGYIYKHDHVVIDKHAELWRCSLCHQFVKTPPEVRFWPYVEKTDTCWLWTGNIAVNGYGKFRHGGSGQYSVHRFAYEHFIGPIPKGLTVDHLCRVRCCVNPAHLEVVTKRENTLRGIGPAAINARKTHCLRGHEFTKENTVTRQGGRLCKICIRIRSRKHYKPHPRAPITQCKHGHDRAIHAYHNGKRWVCRTCQRQHGRDSYHRRQYLDACLKLGPGEVNV